MINHVKGDLLLSDCSIIGHQSNCLGAFGSGIAGQIRRIYPEAYDAFIEDDRTPEEKLGGYSWAHCNNYEAYCYPNKSDYNEKVIYNLYGQFNYGGFPGVVYTNYEALEKALNRMFYNIDLAFGLDKKIGFPYLMGCGLAGGDWGIVYGILDKMCRKYKCDIWLYEYTPQGL